MADNQSRPAPALDHARVFGAFSLLSAILSAAMLVTILLPAPQDPASLLLYVAGHRPRFALAAVTALMWAVFSIPFVVALGRLLRPRSATFAATASVLSAAGILLLGYAVRMSIGAALSVVDASHDLRAPDAVYQAAIWRNLSFLLTDPGLMTWGFGQFLFGWLARNSKVLPNWLAWVGMLGGLAGLLTDAVYQTGAFALLQLASFTVWGVATGAILLRTRTPAAS